MACTQRDFLQLAHAQAREIPWIVHQVPRTRKADDAYADHIILGSQRREFPIMIWNFNNSSCLKNISVVIVKGLHVPQILAIRPLDTLCKTDEFFFDFFFFFLVLSHGKARRRAKKSMPILRITR